MDSIRYISHLDIDKEKWNSCIEASSNGIVFAYSWFLDATSEKWDAIVMNDYEAVFPITKKSKLGISYFFNPIFALQLGIFSKKVLNNELIQQFFDQIPKKLKLIDISLNFGNSVNKSIIKKEFEVFDRKSQFIDLKESYEAISKSYSTNLKRNLSKAKKNKLKIVRSENVENVIEIFKENRGKTLNEMKSEQYNSLRMLINELVKRKKAVIYECWENNVMIASACFSITNNRIIYIKGGSTQRGRELSAMHIIMDKMIYSNSNSNLIFDFGGSSIEQVARFNYGFGSKDYNYQRLYRNSLPFFVKMLKK